MTVPKVLLDVEGRSFLDWLLEHLARGGMTGVVLCCHHAEDGCSCRKPAPGLLLAALAQHGASPSQSWMAGDRATDIEAGWAAGVRTALIMAKEGTDESDRQKGLEPDARCTDLLAFTRLLCGSS